MIWQTGTKVSKERPVLIFLFYYYTAKIEAKLASETFEPIYQTANRLIREESNHQLVFYITLRLTY